MYEMYPDWGPAKHDPDHPLHRATLDEEPSRRGRTTTATALRDDDDQRPDDN